MFNPIDDFSDSSAGRLGNRARHKGHASLVSRLLFKQSAWNECPQSVVQHSTHSAKQMLQLSVGKILELI